MILRLFNVAVSTADVMEYQMTREDWQSHGPFYSTTLIFI